MAKPNNGQSGQIAYGGGNTGKWLYSFRPGIKTFKSPKEGFHNMIFDYSASNKNMNMFVENVTNLSQHIAVSGWIRYDAPTVAYSVRTLNAPAFEVPVKPEKNYKGGYEELHLKEYLDKAKLFDQNKWT